MVPAAKSQKGYCGAYLLFDREANKFVAMTLWESEEDAIANEENRYYQDQLIKVMNLISGTFIREGFEVSVKA
jgi:heme-degrading monooxygenase HmoA